VYFLYNGAIVLTWYLLKIPALFSHKLGLFVKGRKGVFASMETQLTKQDRVIWVHAASLGEFEQGLPVIQRLKKSHPGHKLLVTFFSPSGYEVKKNSREADVITYLPMDTFGNVRRFLRIVSPKMAIFIKYEIWPNYLRALHNQQIPVVLVSGVFDKQQVFFKWYGGFMRKALGRFTHFFLQDAASSQLLHSIGLQNTTVTGDTRFDRVSEILERDNTLPFMKAFKDGHLCFVAGSSWPEDEQLLVPYLETAEKNVKWVIAPHDIKETHIKKLRTAISKKTVLFSEIKEQDLTDADVLIIDTIGLLTKIYSYADIAYVGGGFATGLHNTLEPAIFGIPVIIGPKYEGFKEAEALVESRGILVVHDKGSFAEVADKLIREPAHREKTGKINTTYIAEHRGASNEIVRYLSPLLRT